MKNNSLVLCFLLLLLSSCSPKDDHQITFNFIQLNDVYEIAPGQHGKVGGMARVETIHQRLLSQNPNTLLVMAGDFLNPSLLGGLKHNGERIRGKQMVEVMNAMNFDVVAFGNHEFDLNKEMLQKRINESNFDWITSNIALKEGDSLRPFYREKDGKQIGLKNSYITTLTDKDGTSVRLAIISVCIPSNPVPYVEYSDMFEAIQKEYHEVKDEVDLVFALTHVEIGQDKKIAELLPDLTLILGGHEHTNMLYHVGNVVISKADANAKSIYLHSIQYDTKTKKVVVNSKLKQISDTIPSDKNIETIVDRWQTILTKEIKEVFPYPDSVLYMAKTPLDGEDIPIRSKQTNLGELLAAAMANAYGTPVDCALINGGSIRLDDILEGPVHPVDIFKVLPFGGGIVKVQMTGELLRDVLEYGEKAKGTGAYLQRHHITHDHNIWMVHGERIDSKKIYSVVLTDFLMKGYDIPFLHDKNPHVKSITYPKKDDTTADIRNVVIEYLIKQ